MKSRTGQAFIVSLYTVALYYILYQLSSYFLLNAFSDRFSSAAAMTAGALITIPFILYPLAFTPKPQGGTGTRWEGALWIILTIVIGVVLNIVLTKIPALMENEFYRQSLDGLQSGGFWTLFLCSGVVVPILEEMVFRGVLFGQMRAAFGPIVGTIIASLIFGLVHFNPAQLIYAAAMSIVLCICYDRMKRLWFPILAHSLTNIAVMVLGQLGVIMS